MKRTGALLLAVVVMLLSFESSLGVHFCHDILVESSINKQLSDCCSGVVDQNQPTLSKPCCEIAYFSAELEETSISDVTVELTKFVAFVAVFPFLELYPVVSHQPLQFFSGDPPESSHVELHILFEQYLI